MKYQTTNLRFAIQHQPHDVRPKQPWVAILHIGDTVLTIGVFTAQERAKAWCSHVGTVLRAYGEVSDDDLDTIMSGMPDDFEAEEGEVVCPTES